MDEKACERCGTTETGFNLLDYCAVCSKDLCPACMKLGCCGHVPALSGIKRDFGDDGEQETEE